jgi:hypothetical protein
MGGGRMNLLLCPASFAACLINRRIFNIARVFFTPAQQNEWLGVWLFAN